MTFNSGPRNDPEIAFLGSASAYISSPVFHSSILEEHRWGILLILNRPLWNVSLTNGYRRLRGGMLLMSEDVAGASVVVKCFGGQKLFSLFPGYGVLRIDTLLNRRRNMTVFISSSSKVGSQTPQGRSEPYQNRKESKLSYTFRSVYSPSSGR